MGWHLISTTACFTNRWMDYHRRDFVNILRLANKYEHFKLELNDLVTPILVFHITCQNSVINTKVVLGLIFSVMIFCFILLWYEWWVLLWLSVCSEVQIVCMWSSWCHCHSKTPLSLAAFKSRLVLPFCCRLTQVVLEKRPLNGCSSVVVVADQSKQIMNYNPLI